MVYLKLQPYVQSSLAPRANQKLAFRYFGPFKILSKIGTVAYKVELPSTSAIHPVFDVSQLKKALASSDTVAQLPSHLDGLQILECVLHHRMSPDGVSQILIKWSGMPRSLATWEDQTALFQRFPHAPAWGQAGLLQGGNVSAAIGPTTEVAQHTTETEPAVSDATTEAYSGVGLRRASRPRKVNPHVICLDWVKLLRE